MRTAVLSLSLALVALMAFAAGAAWGQDYITETVDPLAPYMLELERVYELGIIEGYMDNTFRPHEIVERAELYVAFNRLIDVVRMNGTELPGDYEPHLATYGRGVRDHWGMEAWERLLKTFCVEKRPVPLVRNLDAKIKRIEFAELAVAVLRGYGVIPYSLAPAEVALDDEIMVKQADGKVHYQEAMPRWEMAVALSRLLDRIDPTL